MRLKMIPKSFPTKTFPEFKRPFIYSLGNVCSVHYVYRVESTFYADFPTMEASGYAFHLS